LILHRWPLFQVLEEQLVRIVGGGQLWHAKTGEQTPPPIPHGLLNMGGHARILGVPAGLPLETAQELVDAPLHLACGAVITPGAFGIQEACQFIEFCINNRKI